MQIGNQRSKPCSSLISAKRAQLLRSPFPLSCDHPTSLGLPVCCRVAPSSPLASWPQEGVHPWHWGGGCIQSSLRLFACILFPSVLTYWSQIRVVRESKAHSSVGRQWLEGRRKGRGGSLDGAGWWKSCVGLMWCLQRRGGCWQAATPPAARGFSVVQPLPGCTRWLRAIPAGPREISGGEHGLGTGSRERLRDHGTAECFGTKFPF